MDDERIQEALEEIIAILLGLLQDSQPSAKEVFEEMDDTQEFEEASIPEPSSNGQVIRKEQRVESDEMETPPISDSILVDLSENTSDLSVMRRGESLNCIVVGHYTGRISPAISDSFSGAGGRVLCLGDCVDGDGHPLKEWMEYVGDRFQKTIWPVKGDITQSFQGIDRPLDIVYLSTCGAYSDMASMISKWSGLIKPGGFICGGQFDTSLYAASVEAIAEVFGLGKVVSSGANGFWMVQVDAVKAKK
tara:strand:- start:1017 stop:1760 length:744 start_codon:yes stop_codon:yes gene_type:complete